MAETDLARGDAGSARAWWLAIGTLGGGLFALLSAPLPWLLGALAATTTASLTGFTYSVPQASGSR